jgi:ABC-type branched-subunit amino acid transport system substrate-binding protein
VKAPSAFPRLHLKEAMSSRSPRASRYLRPRSATAVTAAVVLAMAGLVACGRSSSGPQASPSATAAPSSSSSTAAAVGSFGTLKDVCGPGSAKGATSRGVTDTTIDIATFSDTGNSISPGIEQEFFDTGDAFVKWCNAAGGINGRKILLHKRDAKLFNAASVVLEACRSDFMQVGGGTALDASTVKPRLACKLGEIPAYHVAPNAVQAGLQVQIGGAPSTQTAVGPFLALARVNPSFKTHTAVYTNNLGSLLPQGKRTIAGLERSGFTIKDQQQFPQTVANWRPYLSVSKNAGTELLYGSGFPGFSPIFAGMSDIGFTPKAFLVTPDNYRSTVSDAVAAATKPPVTYTYSNFLPFEEANSIPVVKQAVDLLTTTATRKSLSGFSDFSLSAWLLWAKSATECGSNLTVDCVLQKAAAHPTWDAGGFAAPFNTDPRQLSYADCFLMIKVTKQGFSYDKDLTQPNSGLFNCNASNVVKGLPTFE